MPLTSTCIVAGQKRRLAGKENGVHKDENGKHVTEVLLPAAKKMKVAKINVDRSVESCYYWRDHVLVTCSQEFTSRWLCSQPLQNKEKSLKVGTTP